MSFYDSINSFLIIKCNLVKFRKTPVKNRQFQPQIESVDIDVVSMNFSHINLYDIERESFPISIVLIHSLSQNRVQVQIEHQISLYHHAESIGDKNLIAHFTILNKD